MYVIPPDMYGLVRKWCGISDGMKVLDVGCGTGFFTRLLAGGGRGVEVTGLDTEEAFIEYARRAGAADQPADPSDDTRTDQAPYQYRSPEYVLGDAFDMPFEDGSFDIVASHTFLTCISDPAGAMSEMKRVVRPGGRIVSMTTMSYMPPAVSLGDWPEDCGWRREFEEYFNRFYRAYFSIDRFKDRIRGLRPAEVPRFFAEQGLGQVSLYPVGRAFSLSNAAMSDDDKLRYIDLYQASEERKLDAYMQLPAMKEYVTEEDAELFRSLIREKCAWHRADLDENSIWEWEGGASVLVTGIFEGKRDHEY